MRCRTPGESEEACEDVGVAESAAICAVCHRSRIRGDRNDAGDVFICARCQADAAQFIAIQDSNLGEAHRAAEVRRTSNDQQHRQGSQG
jgi:hypothetical protein